MAKGHKNSKSSAKLPSMPADCREAMQWFVSNFGLYSGSVRGLFLSDFTEEHEASLEASIISLKSRGFSPLVITGEMLVKQSEYLYDQALAGTTYGRPVATKAEIDIAGADLLILEGMVAPENAMQLWYLHSQIIYPRALAGKATIITTPLSFDEFSRYGAGCQDGDFAGRPITWEKLMWLIDVTMINLDLFKVARDENLPPMLKPEFYLHKALKERGLNIVAQHVLGDYLLDLALIGKDQRLNIECDGLSSIGGYERQAEEAKRNLLLLSDGWQILRFTSAEILSNPAACADVVEEVWRTGRKKQQIGRLLTGQKVDSIPELPFDDEGQQAAIAHGGGPGALIGGAGTGKTTCIVDRVAYLICQGANPDSILILSNSIDTVKTIKAGLDQVLDKQTNLRVQVYAWHDFGFKILKENLAAIKRKAPLKVESNPQKVLQRILEKHKKDLDPATLELSSGLDEFTVSTVINIYKSNLVTAKQVKDQTKDEIGQLIAKVYQAYDEQLQRSNRIDREDMVTLAVQVLLDRQEIRTRYQYSFEFVLVDEYQDVTPAEDALVRLLAAPQDNLYLVGDEDEAIYASKGATPRLLMDVSLRWPQTRCYVLEKNWRSHPAIVDHARQLIAGVANRHTHKEMTSALAPSSTGAISGPIRLASEQAEAEWLAEEIMLLVDSGRKLRDIAVLYRYHHYGPIVEESLARRGIKCMASHPEAGLIPDEVEDMLAFLRLVMDPDGPKAKESFERACQLRIKEIDAKLWSTIGSFAEANNLSFLKGVEIYSEATADQACKDLVQLVRLIRTMKNEGLPPAETISLLKRTQRLAEYYRGMSVPPGVIYEPLRKLNQLEEDARKFQSVAEFVKHLSSLRQHGTGSADPGVHVLTLHEAKGLEFQVVFMIGMAEGLFPAENAGNLDEERRLCYLGFTRAKELLYLSYPAQYNEVSLQPSSFLIEARLLHAAPQAPVQVPPPAPQRTAAQAPQVPVQAPQAPVQVPPPAPQRTAAQAPQVPVQAPQAPLQVPPQASQRTAAQAPQVPVQAPQAPVQVPPQALQRTAAPVPQVPAQAPQAPVQVPPQAPQRTAAPAPQVPVQAPQAPEPAPPQAPQRTAAQAPQVPVQVPQAPVPAPPQAPQKIAAQVQPEGSQQAQRLPIQPAQSVPQQTTAQGQPQSPTRPPHTSVAPPAADWIPPHGATTSRSTPFTTRSQSSAQPVASPPSMPEGGPRIAAEVQQQQSLNVQPIKSAEIISTEPIQASAPVSPEAAPSVPPVSRAPFPSKSQTVSPTPLNPAVEAPADVDVLLQAQVRSQPATQAQAAEEGGGPSPVYSEWAVDASRKPTGTSKQPGKSVLDQALENAASRMSSPVAQGKQIELESPQEPPAVPSLESPISAKPPSKSTARQTKEDAASVIQQDLPQGLLYGQPAVESPLPSQEENFRLDSPASSDAAIPIEPQVYSSQQGQSGYVHPAMESAQIASVEHTSMQAEQLDTDYFEQIEYVRAESSAVVQQALPIDDGPLVEAETTDEAPNMVSEEVAYEAEVPLEEHQLIEYAPQCPNCSISLEPNARFCGECGFHLGTRIPSCPLCSAPLEPSAKFCGECGSNIGSNHSPLPSSPGGMPGAPTQHGWLVKFLKILEN